MQNTVIAQLNELVNREPEHFIFTDCKVRITGDAKIKGVDTSGNKEQHQTQLPDDI